MSLARCLVAWMDLRSTDPSCSRPSRDASTGNGMSMADDHTLRSYRSAMIRIGARPSRRAERAGRRRRSAGRARASDRAERSICRVRAQQLAPGAAARHSRRRATPRRTAPRRLALRRRRARAAIRRGRLPDAAEPYGTSRRRDVMAASYGPSHAYSDAPAAEAGAPTSRLDRRRAAGGRPPGQRAVDAQAQYEDERLQDDRQAAQYYYQDDVPLEPHEDDMYDDAPRARRRGGLATALALVGCAVLGTAGAYAYRSYYGNPDAAQPPPVITADNSTPTKIVPATGRRSAIRQGRPGSAGERRQGTTGIEAGRAGRAQGSGNPARRARRAPAAGCTGARSALRRSATAGSAAERARTSRRRFAPSPFAPTAPT